MNSKLIEDLDDRIVLAFDSALFMSEVAVEYEGKKPIVQERINYDFSYKHRFIPEYDEILKYVKACYFETEEKYPNKWRESRRCVYLANEFRPLLKYMHEKWAFSLRNIGVINNIYASSCEYDKKIEEEDKKNIELEKSNGEVAKSFFKRKRR